MKNEERRKQKEKMKIQEKREKEKKIAENFENIINSLKFVNFILIFSKKCLNKKFEEILLK